MASRMLEATCRRSGTGLIFWRVEVVIGADLHMIEQPSQDHLGFPDGRGTSFAL
jgi:hypothetical protein